MRSFLPSILGSDVSGMLALWLALSIAAVAAVAFIAFFGP
jgi:hypothetical protein